MDSRALRLDTPPAALSRGECLAAWILGFVVAVSRGLAVAKSLWDWDEGLFALAVRHYDVVAHQPHPPGFPLFIAVAKLIPGDEFRAVQTVTVVASLFVFPAMLMLAREMRVRPPVAIASAVLLAFLPNVWLFGGTGLSDVPSMVLTLVAAAALLRGCRDGRFAVAGAVLLAVAIGFRPQNALVGLAPALLALRCRPRAALMGAVLASGVLAASYGIAARESGGWSAYRGAIAQHERYIRGIDSYLSPLRPPLRNLADDFFYRPFRMEPVNAMIGILASLGLLGAMRRRETPILLGLAMFAPFAVLAWLYLDFHSTSRFSIAYMPLLALLAASGLPRRARWIVLAIPIATSAFLLWPGLAEVRNNVSPPVAAVAAIRALDPGSTIVYFNEAFDPHAALLLEGYQRTSTTRDVVAVMNEKARVVSLREGVSEGPGALSFVRPLAGLAGIVRPRYFEVSVAPVARMRFRQGWWGEEGPVLAPFRWMSKAGRVEIPPHAGRVRIEARFHVPVAAAVDVSADGRAIDRILVNGATTVERSWAFDSAPRDLSFATSATAHAPGDPREFGLRLDGLRIQ